MMTSEDIGLPLGEQTQLLDAVDSLRRFGVESDIGAPHLIVIGDQSSGKSSVLEAICRVQLAIHHRLCTRFPIELVIRRSDSFCIEASIMPGKAVKRSQSDLEGIKRFTRSGCQANQVPEIIEAAEIALGISTNAQAQFTDDILRIYISGPKQYPLTLIDLPGLYRAANQDQGNEGIDFVHNLTERYAEQSQGIILAVIPASSDRATQECIAIANKHDSQKVRTLGIITRPDVVEPGPDAREIVQLASSGSRELKNGWHIVKNLTSLERERLRLMPMEQVDIFTLRDNKEAEFLNTGCWAEVPECDKGIERLRSKLRRILFARVQAKLPDLIDSARKCKEDRRSQMDIMSKPRKSINDQQVFLVPMAQEFVRLANAAILGSYEDPFFGRPGDKGHQAQSPRLRAIILETSRLFNIVLFYCGRKVDIDGEELNDKASILQHRSRFQGHQTQMSESSASNSVHSLFPDMGGSGQNARPDSPLAVEESSKSSQASASVMDEEIEIGRLFAEDQWNTSSDSSSILFQDLESSVLDEAELKKYCAHRKPALLKWEAIGAFMCTQVARWSGHEGPADTNPNLAKAFFEIQSSSWDQIVQSHGEVVWTAVETFVYKATSAVVHESVLSRVNRHIIEPALRTLRQDFRAKCDEIVKSFQQINPTQFVGSTDLSNLIAEAERIVLRPRLRQIWKSKNRVGIDLEDASVRSGLISAIKAWGLATTCCRELGQALAPSIQLLAIESCIRQVPEVFSARALMQFPDEVLSKAAGEMAGDMKLREGFTKDIADLEEAEEALIRLSRPLSKGI